MTTPRLRPITDELWGATYDLMMNGIVHFPGRMTVVRLADGGLWLCSPIPIDDALAAELAALGPVAHIVAPNRLHHLHLPGAIERYPKATVWAAPGLPEKRKDVSFHGVLDDEASPPWSDELPHVFLAGSPWMNEVVFLHRASRSLVITDLMFNLHHVRGWFTRLVLRMVRAYRRPGQSRLVRVTTKDRDAFATSLRRMLAWDIDRIVLAHGEIVADDPKGTLAGALAWVLGESALPERAAAGSGS
jgi:hypothetical protein